MPKLGRLCKLVGSVALMGLGCTGQVGDPGSPNAGGASTGSGSGAPGTGGGPRSPGSAGGGTPNAAADAPGEGVFRRLSRLEYNNTVRDLLGDNSAPASSFPPDEDSAKSGYFAGGTVADTDAAHLLDAAEALGTNAVPHLATLLPCQAIPAAPADQDACAHQFITQFGKRAFRRPVTTDEASDLFALYSSQRTAGQDFPNAMRVLISGFMMSPQFLYLWEVTPQTAVKDGNLIRYNSYEMASRLSYLLWASLPDEAGFALADQNKLSTPDQIEAEARRLLQDPKAKGAVADFFTQWLGVTQVATVSKDPNVFPTFTPDLAASMYNETAAFAAETVIDGDSKLSTIFTSSSSYIDANLAKLYAVSGITSPTVVKTALDPTQRSGILTQASFLTQFANPDETNPVRRGKRIASNIICTAPPPPPDNVPDPKPPAPNLSVRERFTEHDTNPCAAACHMLLDPIGFGFENYNGIGGWQTVDGMKPVDASGRIPIDGQTRTFKNGLELESILGQSPQVADCMTRQFLRYALRRLETAGDEASIAAAEATFTKQQNNLKELMVAITKSHSFTHRAPSLGEVFQ